MAVAEPERPVWGKPLTTADAKNKTDEAWGLKDEHRPPKYEHRPPKCEDRPFRYEHKKPSQDSHLPPEHKRAGIFLLFFGVVLPAVAVLAEARYHMCAQQFFDPIPSPAHVMLCLLVPLSNFLYWQSTREDLSDHYAFMSLTNGMAMGIGILYALMFLPTVPLAAIGIVCLGLGLLPLSPMLSLPFTWRAGQGICALAEYRKTYFDAHQLKHFGHLIILVAVVAIELPSTLTRMNIYQATQHNGRSLSAIKWLRSYGDKGVMLRSCYEHSGRATDILGTLFETSHPLDVFQTRKVFYQVTGEPFNSVPIPADARATIGFASSYTDSDLNSGVDDEFDFDPDIAGEMVNGLSRGLSLSSSKIAAKIDGHAAAAKMQWTFGFTNGASIDREARFKILLPASTVVDGATIVVDGREHKAEIIGRSLARAAYSQAVHTKQNPLLVSTCGIDQVLVQCYPVAPGSKISINLTMVAPVTVDPTTKAATLVLPAFAERNFLADEKTTVEVASTTPLNVGQSALLRASSDNRQLSGSVDNTQLSRFATVIGVQLAPDTLKNILARDTKPYKWGPEDTNGISTPQDLTVLVDCGASMSPYIKNVVCGLKLLPATVKTKIYAVDDSSSFQQGLGKPISLAELEQVECAGGQDDSSMLAALLRRPDPSHIRAVLWIHAAQPVSKFARKISAHLSRPDSPTLFDLQVAAGPDEVMDGATVSRSAIRVPNTGNAEQSLRFLIDSWGHYGPDYSSKPETFEASIWLAELHGNQAVRQYLADSDKLDLAAHIATSLHIVTPLSSAVVIDPLLLEETRRTTANHNEIPTPDSDLRALSSIFQEPLDWMLQPFRWFTNPAPSSSLFSERVRTISAAEMEQLQSGQSSIAKKAVDHENAPTDLSSTGTFSPSAQDATTAKKIGMLDATGLSLLPEAKPTPEPDTYALMAAMGILLVGALAVTRRRSVQVQR